MNIISWNLAGLSLEEITKMMGRYNLSIICLVVKAKNLRKKGSGGVRKMENTLQNNSPEVDVDDFSDDCY
jgi:hypothetical protein